MRGKYLLASLALAASLIAVAAPAKQYTSLRFGMDAAYPPFESVNSKGEIVGFEVDYAKALCEQMRLTCTFQNQDWDGIIPSLMAAKYFTVDIRGK